MAETPTLPALLVDAAGVGAMLSISRTRVYQMDSSGELGPVALRFGRRLLPAGGKGMTEPLLLRAVDCAKLYSVSTRHWWQLAAEGKVPPSLKLGKARLWRRDLCEKHIALNCPALDRFEQLLRAEEGKG